MFHVVSWSDFDEYLDTRTDEGFGDVLVVIRCESDAKSVESLMPLLLSDAVRLSADRK